MWKFLILVIFAVGIGVPAVGAGPDVVLKDTKDTLGNTLTYPGGQAEITGVMITVPVGGSNEWHSHPVPTFGYQMSGELTVEYATGETRVFKAGSSIIEAQHTPHRSHNTGDVPVKIIVFYAGAEGLENTSLGK